MKFNTNKFLKFISKWKYKENSRLKKFGRKVDMNSFDLPHIFTDFFQEYKYSPPKNFISLHKYFKKISKKLKYETIFNVYDDHRKQKGYQYWFELGVLILQYNKKKYFFITKFWHDTLGATDPIFDIERKYKVKKFPSSEKLYQITSEYLFNEYYFPRQEHEVIEDLDGYPIAGTWGSVANFSSNLGLKEIKFKREVTRRTSAWGINNVRRRAIENLFFQQAKINFNYQQ